MTGEDTVSVYDVTEDRIRDVPRAEAAAGIARFARTLGPGTPACGEFEAAAMEVTGARTLRDRARAARKVVSPGG